MSYIEIDSVILKNIISDREKEIEEWKTDLIDKLITRKQKEINSHLWRRLLKIFVSKDDICLNGSIDNYSFEFDFIRFKYQELIKKYNKILILANLVGKVSLSLEDANLLFNKNIDTIDII